MTSTNMLGVRIIAIMLITTGTIFGSYKLVSLAFSHTTVDQPSPSPIAQNIPIASPVPVQSFSPEFLKQMADFAKQKPIEIGPETKKYVSTLPKDATQGQVLGQSTITNYVDANKGRLLPELPSGTVKTTTATGKTAIQTYLDSISQSHNKKITLITGTDILNAFQKQESREDVLALTPILTKVQANYTILQTIKAPKEVVALHTKLLQATQSLVANILRLQSFKTDQINGLIGLKNISDLNPVFTDIANQISVLEKKYNLK